MENITKEINENIVPAKALCQMLGKSQTTLEFRTDESRYDTFKKNLIGTINKGLLDNGGVFSETITVSEINEQYLDRERVVNICKDIAEEYKANGYIIWSCDYAFTNAFKVYRFSITA